VVLLRIVLRAMRAVTRAVQMWATPAVVLANSARPMNSAAQVTKTDAPRRVVRVVDQSIIARQKLCAVLMTTKTISAHQDRTASIPYPSI
jgi:hypothetical protein